jgi:hypothetical protein
MAGQAAQGPAWPVALALALVASKNYSTTLYICSYQSTTDVVFSHLKRNTKLSCPIGLVEKR